MYVVLYHPSKSGGHTEGLSVCIVDSFVSEKQESKDGEKKKIKYEPQEKNI